MDSYEEFEALIQSRVACINEPLFTVALEEGRAWYTFLDHLTQHYNCKNCARFIETYGSLVMIRDGKNYSPLFSDSRDVPSFFTPAVHALAELLERSRVTGVFQWDSAEWGTPYNTSKKTGARWTHLHGYLKGQDARVEDAGQRMARLKEDHGVLCRAFGDYSVAVVDEAIRVLEADVLDRTDKALAIAKWFRGVDRYTPNAIWLAVATAPAGFTHVKNTVVATLFDDVKNGLSFESASARWAEKMHPLQYQRPTKQVSNGAVVAAQQLVEKLGVARSFERRFARISDIQDFVWVRSQVRIPNALFSQLRKDVKRMVLPGEAIKEISFTDLKDLLQNTRDLEIKLPSHGSYYGMATAVHADAPCLLQWDNHVSWYFYHGGSSPSHWGLKAGWARPDAVFLPPDKWGGTAAEPTKHVCFAFSEAQDPRNDYLGLFPEILKSEYHGIRAVVEANNRSMKVQGKGEVNGYAFKDIPLEIRVDGEPLRLVSL